MGLVNRVSVAPVLLCAGALAGVLLAANVLMADPPGAPSGTAQAEGSANTPASVCEPASLGSPYIPVDSWVYPAVMRLYSLGFAGDIFLGIRPWTRASLLHVLEGTETEIQDANGSSAAEEAEGIYEALMHFLEADIQGPCMTLEGNVHLESSYTLMRAISGTPLRDSYHLGSTIINDYGRPYENGFNNYTGASGYASAGRFAVYVRGEFQGAPSAAGYPAALAQILSSQVDFIPFINPLTNQPYNQTTIPLGPIGTATDGRFLEAYVSAQVLNHVISFGKQDEWLGPAMGASMAFSNNAENFYAFHINRIEPLYIPGLSKITGPFRYEFLVGSLRGHTLVPNPAYPAPNQPNVINPGDPWVHVEKINFKPTKNLEFGFERTALFGGKGHSPVTIHTFLKSFFSLAAPSAAVKYSRSDPGARFGSFDCTYRLPYLRNWLTFYTDSEVHDDVSPIDAPRRAAWRPGLFLSHVPGIPKLDIRGEAAMTDPSVSTSQGGKFMYWETIEKQGYTNEGQIFGDWIGREDKGGQAWVTYHLSGNEWVQVGMRNQKAAKDFIPDGTTLNDINFQVVKRIKRDLELRGNFTLEHWKAPIYLPGEQTVTSTELMLTWYPKSKISF